MKNLEIEIKNYQLNSDKTYMKYELDKYSEYQNYLYKRALYGLNALNEKELITICSKKKQRILNVYKKAQTILNVLKQKISINYTNSLFLNLFPNSNLTTSLIENTEIDEKFKIFKKHKIVVDLGCAPGGWSQYCVGKVGEGNVAAIDLLPVSPIAGVNFMQLDFLTDDAPQKIIDELKKTQTDSDEISDSE